MPKKSASQKRALRDQQERTALGNIFNVFLTGLGVECLLFLLYRFYINGSISAFLALHSVLSVTVWLGLAALLGGIGIAVAKKSDQKIRKIGLLTGFSGFLMFLISWITTRLHETGLTGLCIVVPVVTVLGLVYFLYQRECFVNTTLLAGSLFTIWVCSNGLGGYWSTLVTILTCGVLVGLAAVAVLLGKLKKNEGKFRDIHVFSTDCDYRLLYAVCAVCFAAILLVLLVPTLSFYMTWALVIGLFAELAFYTTKLM